MYAAILFDLDNTLIDRDAAFHELVKETFPSSAAIGDELLSLDDHGRSDRKQLIERWQALGGDRLGADMFGVLIARFVHRQHELVRALRSLAQTTKLAIVTNGGTASQVAKWRAAGFESVIPRERFWISAEVGIDKPDPAIFRLACGAMEVQPRDCLYVGDRADVDLVGAQAAGMSAMLVPSPLTPNQLAPLRRSTPLGGCES